jgi:hypothetical protein
MKFNSLFHQKVKSELKKNKRNLYVAENGENHLQDPESEWGLGIEYCVPVDARVLAKVLWVNTTCGCVPALRAEFMQRVVRKFETPRSHQQVVPVHANHVEQAGEEFYDEVEDSNAQTFRQVIFLYNFIFLWY